LSWWISFLGFLVLLPDLKGALFACLQQTTGGEIWEIEYFYAAYEDYLWGSQARTCHSVGLALAW
jgi:hypothetical protein